MREFCTGVMLTVLLVIVFEEFTASYRHGYEKGQIDALTGNVKYELIKQADGTVIWEKKK